MYLLYKPLGIKYDEATTVMYYIVGFVSILAVIKACRPFNKLRAFLASTTAVGFFVATILFKNLLQLSSIGSTAMIVLGILFIFSTIIITTKNKITCN